MVTVAPEDHTKEEYDHTQVRVHARNVTGALGRNLHARKRIAFGRYVGKKFGNTNVNIIPDQ